jgi:hypothetical protein
MEYSRKFSKRIRTLLCPSKPAGGIFDVAGVFDSHTLPPFVFNDLRDLRVCLRNESEGRKRSTVVKTVVVGEVAEWLKAPVLRSPYYFQSLSVAFLCQRATERSVRLKLQAAPPSTGRLQVNASLPPSHLCLTSANLRVNQLSLQRIFTLRPRVEENLRRTN